MQILYTRHVCLGERNTHKQIKRAIDILLGFFGLAELKMGKDYCFCGKANE